MEIVRFSDRPYSATCLPTLSKRLRITALYYHEGQKSCLTKIRDVDYSISYFLTVNMDSWNKHAFL